MVWAKLETWDELKAITLFHVLGVGLELFKTSAAIRSWSYPDRNRRMPLLLAFVLIGFFVWLAENVSTFFGIWRYPDQLGAWTSVHVGKWSSWSLLVVMTFTIVANLKHIKERVHVPA